MIKTIGHSNHSIEHFIDLLKRGRIDLLVDVRSVPYSRRFPQFGREQLARSLAAASINYIWEGEALGGKGADYNQAAARPAFHEALDRVVAHASDKTICLMCAEKEPLDCHRTMLVSRRLTERGTSIVHLLADGGTRTHGEVERALLAKAAGTDDLFEDRARLLARAYDARELAMRGKAT